MPKQLLIRAPKGGNKPTGLPFDTSINARQRSDILTSFPEAPGLGRSVASYMKQVDEVYFSDAYNSLSIEGCKVSAELIDRVRSGHWNPDSDKSDHDHRDAMAARGYWLSFQSVRQSEAVRDLMPAFFELLQQEEEAAVRVVLGHFMFVYIHPYFDGNGRIGRFLMNVMMASGGYPWTIVTVDRRNDYMAALEVASVDGDIKPFSGFLAGLIK